MYFNIIYTFKPVFAAGVILSESSTTILIYIFLIHVLHAIFPYYLDP